MQLNMYNSILMETLKPVNSSGMKLAQQCGHDKTIVGDDNRGSGLVGGLSSSSDWSFPLFCY